MNGYRKSARRWMVGAVLGVSLATVGLATFWGVHIYGKDALRGVGGTRHCDWWFTDKAILLDTAGRYTTQDSNTRADAAGWVAFLQLLRKFRKDVEANFLAGIAVVPEVAARVARADSLTDLVHDRSHRLQIGLVGLAEGLLDCLYLRFLRVRQGWEFRCVTALRTVSRKPGLLLGGQYRLDVRYELFFRVVQPAPECRALFEDGADLGP
mgnify:CR=1 FL=1